MKKISVLLVVHNEEKQISDCLEKLGFADEIVVILDKTRVDIILQQFLSIDLFFPLYILV